MFRNLKIMLKFKFGKGIRLRHKTCPICRKKHIMIGTNISEYIMVSSTLRTIRYIDLCKHCTRAFRNIGSDLGMDADGDTASMVLGVHTD